jgi:hypothetical protein
MMHAQAASPSGFCSGLALLLVGLSMLAVHDAQADALVRFHCHGMMGGHQNGMRFDALLDADFTYDPAAQVIAREQNGKPAGNWKVAVDGQVLRWTVDETREFLDLEHLAYGFDWRGEKDNVAYGRASCSRKAS